MEAGLPESDSEQSQEGTFLHDLYGHPEYDRGLLKPQLRDLVELADTLSGLIIKRCEEVYGLSGPIREYRELNLKTNEGISGTPDRLRHYYEDKAVVILDPKFGFNVVERAELNLQLRAYAVMGFDAMDNPKQVIVSIAQPRAPYDERITIASYSEDDVAAARSEINAIVKASSHDRARLNAGEEQCRYCKAASALICPAFRDSMLLPATITPDNALSKRAREAFLEQRLSECSDEQLEKVLLAIKLSALVKLPAQDEARKRIAEGKLTSFTVTKDIEVRKIADVRRALAILSLAGVPKDDVFDCVSEFAITRLTENLRKRHPNWTWKDANDSIDKKLASVIERETRHGRIVPAK